MFHITIDIVLSILREIALVEFLLIGALLLLKAGDIIRIGLLTDDEPNKIEAPKAELKEEPQAKKETKTKREPIGFIRPQKR